MPDRITLTAPECLALLDRLFPQGPGGADVRCALADAPEMGLCDDTELAERVTLGLWDVFSDNHEVTDEDGRLAELGSFRGTAATLAAWHDRGRHGGPRQYADFYLGTTRHRPAWRYAVHRLVFQRLRGAGADWRYSFPRMYLFDLGAPATPPDPAAAHQREIETAALRARLDDAHHAELERAQAEPPPDIVRAFREVYGRRPRGWPPR